MEDFVVVRKCFSQIEAHQLKNLLDNGGVFCQLMNETVSQVYNFHAPSDGGILLLVHERDVANANQILKSDVNLEAEVDNNWNNATEEIISDQPASKKSKVWIMLIITLLLISLSILAALTRD